MDNVKNKRRRNPKVSPEDVGGAVRSSEDGVEAGVRAEGVAGAGELGGEGDLGPGRGRGARGRLGHCHPVQSLVGSVVVIFPSIIVRGDPSNRAKPLPSLP